MGLFNHKKEDDPLGGRDTMMNNGVTPVAQGYGASAPNTHQYGTAHQSFPPNNQPTLGYGDSTVPGTLDMPNVPTLPAHGAGHHQQPAVAQAALQQQPDVNDRYAGAQSHAGAYGTQMSGNHVGGAVPTNAAGNLPSQHAMHDPSRNYQAPLQETQPFEETGIGGQTVGHHRHSEGATHLHQTHHQPGIGHGGGTGAVHTHPGHSVIPGRRIDETTGPTNAAEAHAELKEAKKDATKGNLQMMAGKILSSETMQAKGQAKVDRADALKAQAEHLGAAEQLEAEAQNRRRLAQGGDIHNTKLPGCTHDTHRNLA